PHRDVPSFPTRRSSDLIAGVRRSWIDSWLKPVLVEAGASVTSAPVYYDYQAFVETKPTSRSSLRIGVLGSDDRFEMLMRDVAERSEEHTSELQSRENLV